MSRLITVLAHRVVEFSLNATHAHADPFNTLEVDAVFNGPTGEMRVPAFWAGNHEWRVRFSAFQPGHYTYRTTCAATDDSGLDGQTGRVDVLPTPEGETNPLYRHGGIRPAASRAYLEHQDGTPFFWLGDTWWMAFCGRMGWPEDFQRLVADRKSKGFSVGQMVAGLFPDMQPLDQRGWNEGGPAWQEGFTHINPPFFDQADLKLQYMVSQGILPLVVSAWGYYLPLLGIEKMKKHWRYLVARWGAYPVAWCLAGEVAMPFYLAKDKAADAMTQKQGWSEVGRYLAAVDPFHRPLTVHSSAYSESPRELTDPSCLDFNFFQAAHGNLNAAVTSARHAATVVQTTTLKPVINGETTYEGILGTAWQDVQRFSFWSNWLSGVMGYSYGANGVWQVNRPGEPFGPSPHGMSWGDLPWQDAMALPGSTQVGLGKRLLETYPWWKFEPHPEWIDPHAGGENWLLPYAAGIPGQLAVVYFPYPLAPWEKSHILHGLQPGQPYTAFYFNPANGAHQAIPIEVDAQGDWQVTGPSLGQDMVLVVEKNKFIT
ncbi:MAG TPA: DUF4038 domain-containing protein [Anaerolineaceae bacterium]